MKSPQLSMPTAATDLVTLTMNPALDISAAGKDLVKTEKIRCDTARYDPGGGGVNVARIAKVFGTAATAVFPAGGAMGATLCSLLTRAGVVHQTVQIGGQTRSNFTFAESTTGYQYRFVLPGPAIQPDEERQIFDMVRRAAVTARFLVVSGSLPPGLSAGFYDRVAESCRSWAVRLILDSSGADLATLHSHAYLVKPSVRELCEWVGRELTDVHEMVTAASELIAQGRAEAILISRGCNGAVLVTGAEHYRFDAPVMPAGSGVGAGDALVAGVVTGLLRRQPLCEAVRLGMAAGAAMLLTPGTAVFDIEDVARLLPSVGRPSPIENVTEDAALGSQRFGTNGP